MDQPPKAKEGANPLLQIKGPLTIDQVKLLAERIQNAVGQLCVLTINRSYVKRERMVFRLTADKFLSNPRSILGPSRDEDYVTCEVNESWTFGWRAEKPPVHTPAGILTIPTEQHILITSGSYLMPTGIQYCTGPIAHKFLRNEPYGLSEDFPVLQHVPATDLGDILTTFIRICASGYGENEKVALNFFVGDKESYEHMFPFIRIQHVSDDWLIRRASAIESLGCQLPPELAVRITDAVSRIKQSYKRQILEELHLGHGNKAKELRDEYESKFGEPFDSVSLDDPILQPKNLPQK